MVSSAQKNIPKKVTFYRNGDRNFSGSKLLVTGQRYRTWEALLVELSKKLEQGIHRVYNVSDRRAITSVNDITDGESYVCTGQERLKMLNYTGIDKKTWAAGKKASKPDPRLGVAASPDPSTRKPVVPRIAPEVKANANVVVFYRNGDVTHRGARILLNAKNTASFDRVLDLVSEKVDIVGGVNALYSPDGQRIRHGLELLSLKEVIAAGSERFRGDKLPHRLIAKPRPDPLPAIQATKSELTKQSGREYAESRGVKTFPSLPPVAVQSGHDPFQDGPDEDEQRDSPQDLLQMASSSMTSTRGNTPFPGASASDRSGAASQPPASTRKPPAAQQLHEDVVLSKIEDDRAQLQKKLEFERLRQKSRLQLRIAERKAGKFSPPAISEAVGEAPEEAHAPTATTAVEQNDATSKTDDATIPNEEAQNGATDAKSEVTRKQKQHVASEEQLPDDPDEPVEELKGQAAVPTTEQPEDAAVPTTEQPEDAALLATAEPEVQAVPAAADASKPQTQQSDSLLEPQHAADGTEAAATLTNAFGVPLGEEPPSDDEDFRTFTMMDFRRVAFLWMNKDDPKAKHAKNKRRKKFTKVEQVAAEVIQAWYRNVKGTNKRKGQRPRHRGNDHNDEAPATASPSSPRRSPRPPPRKPHGAVRSPKLASRPHSPRRPRTASSAKALYTSGATPATSLANVVMPPLPATANVQPKAQPKPEPEPPLKADEEAAAQAEFERLEQLAAAGALSDLERAAAAPVSVTAAAPVEKPVHISKRRRESFATPDLTVSKSMLDIVQNKAASKIQAAFKGRQVREQIAADHGKRFSAGQSGRAERRRRRKQNQQNEAASSVASSVAPVKAASRPSVPQQQQKPEETYSSYGIVKESAVTTLYTLGEQLGDGNFAVVRLCTRNEDGKDFAIKIISKDKIVGDRERQMIKQEIATMKAIDHPSCIQLHDVYETQQNLYLIVELCPGGDLFDRVVAKGHFSEADASRLIRSLATAINHLHGKGIVHRDLKPENCLVAQDVDGNDIIKLGDFGLATHVADPLHQICGTPTYVAPEIIKEDSPGYGTQVDCWAVGVIAYILLCGFPPFASTSKDQKDLFNKIRAGAFSFPEQYWRGISDSARHLISSLLKVDPADRYTADQILEHPWVSGDTARRDDLPVITELLKHFPAKRKWKKAVFKLAAVRKIDSGHQLA